MSIIGISFNGPISHPATTKLRNACCMAVNDRLDDGRRKYSDLYLFFNSSGGAVDDGIGLYGFLRSLPISITTINVNQIASIAIVPFLGGRTRIGLPHCTFHFHDFEWNYATPHNLTRLEYQDHTQILDSGKATALQLLKDNTALTDEDFKNLKLMDVPLIQGADFAKEKGIIHEIEYVTIPEDMPIYNVDY